MFMKTKAGKTIGTLIALIITAYGVWLFYNLIRPKKPIETYTKEDLTRLYNDCYIYAKVTKYYPEISKANCQCLTEETTKKYTKDELEKLDNMSQEQRNEELKDIIAKCAHLSGRDTVHVLNRP